MSLEFWIQDDASLGRPECFSTAQYVDSLEMGEYEKLEPCWELCRQQGIPVGGYFDDTF
jgi:hypothetical protein